MDWKCRFVETKTRVRARKLILAYTSDLTLFQPLRASNLPLGFFFLPFGATHLLCLEEKEEEEEGRKEKEKRKKKEGGRRKKKDERSKKKEKKEEDDAEGRRKKEEDKRRMRKKEEDRKKSRKKSKEEEEKKEEEEEEGGVTCLSLLLSCHIWVLFHVLEVSSLSGEVWVQIPPRVFVLAKWWGFKDLYPAALLRKR